MFVNQNKYKYTVTMINIYEEVRILLLRKGMSMRKIAAHLRERGCKVPIEGGLSTQFNRKRIKFQTVQEILDYLGYELVIHKKE